MPEIEIYTRDWCGYCRMAKALLDRKGAPYREISLEAEPERIDEMTKRAGGRRTVPQVFIGGTHVGGCDDLQALDRAGRLDPLLRA